MAKSSDNQNPEGILQAVLDAEDVSSVSSQLDQLLQQLTQGTGKEKIAAKAMVFGFLAQVQEDQDKTQYYKLLNKLAGHGVFEPIVGILTTAAAKQEGELSRGRQENMLDTLFSFCETAEDPLAYLDLLMALLKIPSIASGVQWVFQAKLLRLLKKTNNAENSSVDADGRVSENEQESQPNQASMIGKKTSALLASYLCSEVPNKQNMLPQILDVLMATLRDDRTPPNLMQQIDIMLDLHEKHGVPGEKLDPGERFFGSLEWELSKDQNQDASKYTESLAKLIAAGLSIPPASLKMIVEELNVGHQSERFQNQNAEISTEPKLINDNAYRILTAYLSSKATDTEAQKTILAQLLFPGRSYETPILSDEAEKYQLLTRLIYEKIISPRIFDGPPIPRTPMDREAQDQLPFLVGISEETPEKTDFILGLLKKGVKIDPGFLLSMAEHRELYDHADVFTFPQRHLLLLACLKQGGLPPHPNGFDFLSDRSLQLLLAFADYPINSKQTRSQLMGYLHPSHRCFLIQDTKEAYDPRASAPAQPLKNLKLPTPHWFSRVMGALVGMVTGMIYAPFVALSLALRLMSNGWKHRSTRRITGAMKFRFFVGVLLELFFSPVIGFLRGINLGMRHGISFALDPLAHQASLTAGLVMEVDSIDKYKGKGDRDPSKDNAVILLTDGHAYSYMPSVLSASILLALIPFLLIATGILTPATPIVGLAFGLTSLFGLTTLGFAATVGAGVFVSVLIVGVVIGGLVMPKAPEVEKDGGPGALAGKGVSMGRALDSDNFGVNDDDDAPFAFGETGGWQRCDDADDATVASSRRLD